MNFRLFQISAFGLERSDRHGEGDRVKNVRSVFIVLVNQR
jgi:hypothetical protein